MSWPPAATRARTRATWWSSLSRPTNHTSTSWVRAALAILAGMVWPPRVVSIAKLRRRAMASSSRRTPSCQAATLALRWSQPVAAFSSRAKVSGLNQGRPWRASRAPPTELLPAPLTPASTNRTGRLRAPALRSMAGTGPDLAAQRRRGVHDLAQAVARIGFVQGGQPFVEAGAQDVEHVGIPAARVLHGAGHSRVGLERHDHGLGLVVVGDQHAAGLAHGLHHPAPAQGLEGGGGGAGQALEEVDGIGERDVLGHGGAPVPWG